MRVAVKIGYDGGKFYGFSIQPNFRTVEGELLKKLIKTKIIEDKISSSFQYASRTDRGVSAFGNIIAFNTRSESVFAIDKIPDIWVFGVKKVNENFNPRHCKLKIYRYYLYNENIDVNRLEELSKLFIGKHNFSNFIKNDGKNPTKSIDDIYVQVENNVIKIDFEGKSFLWNQIRRIVSALIKCSKNEVKRKDLIEAINNRKKCDFGIAPPQNLILLDVKYDMLFQSSTPYEIEIKREIFNDALCMHRNK